MRFTLVQAGLGARHGLRRCPHPSGFGSRERLGISHRWAKVPRRYWAGNSQPSMVWMVPFDCLCSGQGRGVGHLSGSFVTMAVLCISGSQFPGGT